MKRIALLLVFSVSAVNGFTTRESQAFADIKSLESAIEMYRLNAKILPNAEEGLRALVERPSMLDSNVRWVQYLNELPNDPWGNPYCYIAGDGFSRGFGIYSRGADGVSMSQGNDADDISSWRIDALGSKEQSINWSVGSLSACIFTGIIAFIIGRYSARNHNPNNPHRATRYQPQC